MAHGLSCSAARGIFPDQGLNPRPLYWKLGVLTSGPPGKSGCVSFFFFNNFFGFLMVTFAYIFKVLLMN